MSKKFRLYPDHKTLYFEVEIYDTRKRMLDATKKESIIKVPSDTIAFTDCVDIVLLEKNRKPKTRKVGKLYFFKNGIDVDTVSHEMLHAVNGYFSRLGFLSLDLTTGQASNFEECFAYCLGRMIKDFFGNRNLKELNN